MSKQLIKQPNMFVFWLVLASGLAVVFTGQNDTGGVFPAVARTVFWCSAVAYFSLRIYQFVLLKKQGKQSDPLLTKMPDKDD